MQKPKECDECPLGKKFPNKEGDLITLGQSFSLSEGQPRFGVRFVGEALGSQEAQEGLPFRPNGESGSLITHIIENNLPKVQEKDGKVRKMKRSDFQWDNVVKCRPPNNELTGKSYEQGAIEHCRIYNSRSFGGSSSFDSTHKRVIVALGGVAFKELTGISGKKLGIEDVRGYVFSSSNYDALIIGALHPSFIRHGNARFTSSLIYDIKKALLVANGSYHSFGCDPDFKRPDFVKTGKLEALVSFYYRMRDNPASPIYYDIENPYTKGEEEEDKGELEDEELEDSGKERSNEITSIQFTDRKDWAINAPWEKPFIKVALAILALPNDKVGANVWHHDNPRLEANSARINGTIHDLMWAWHHLQPGLWKGLQRIASMFDVPYNWKHLALSGNTDDDDEYGCMDVVAPAYIWPSLILKMKRMGVWESYLKFKVNYRAKVLKPAEIRGLPADIGEHQRFKVWVEGEVKKEDEQLQREVPECLRNIAPKRPGRIHEQTGLREYSYGYIKEPPIIRGLREAYNLTANEMLARGLHSEHIIPFEKWAERKSGFIYKEFERDGSSNDSLFDDAQKIRRWCKVEPFKASSQQLVRYLKYRMEEQARNKEKVTYYVPQTLKTKKDTTGKKELQEVWEHTGDPLLGNVIRLRSYSKMLSNDIPNWLPDKDGVVRTSFLFDPPSWQLNSRSPNIQNASKHPKEWELIGRTASELTLIGQRFRRIVKAPPGRCVVEVDKSGFHVNMMGFEAKDPLYLKWGNSLHTAFASYIAGEPISLEGEIDKDKLNYIKKKYKNIRDGQAKPTVLGNQLGLGHVKLHYMNKTFIDSEGKRQVGIESRKRAKYLQEMLASLFPKVEAYKKRIVEEAHFKSFLISHYGAIRWFYDAMRWDYKQRRMRNSTEAEQAISHPVQSDSFGMIHSEFIDMAENSDILEEHWFASTVHDSGVFFPEIGKREKAIEQIVGFMRKPDKVLVDPVCCPNGLVVDVEVMASCEGGNWSAYHKERNPEGIQEIKI